MKTKLLSFLLIFTLTINVFATNTKAVIFEPSDFEIISESAYLVNMDTDTVLYEKNKDTQLIPASLTKIMTAILALEQVEDLSVMVTAPVSVFNEIYGMNASNAGIMAHEEVAMIDLLYGLILPSGCEAGGIIADYIGNGDTSAFVQMMNDRAKELGAMNTNFADAHGLDNDSSYTTAYDMYLLTKHALSLPHFEEIATAKVHEMPATNKHSSSRNIYHTNKMIQTNTNYFCDFIKGIKTGTTGVDTKNLVTIAEKNGYKYMCVTLGAPRYTADGSTQEGTYIDTQNLYDWAFDDVQMRTILNESDDVGEVSVKMGKEQDYVLLNPSEKVSLLMPNDIDLSSVQKIIDTDESIIAPVEKGDVVGSMTLKLKDETLATVDLVASSDISRAPISYAFYKAGTILKSPILHLVLLSFLALVAIYVIFAILYNKKKKKVKYKMKSKPSNKMKSKPSNKRR